MNVILNIDTAVETASVCLADEENIIGFKANPSQKDHAAWLHEAIKNVLEENNLGPQHLNAIAISQGPGSYTGLRVGMSAAKGLCYALNIPLIGISTLKMMASAAVNETAEFFCPMIDARRAEVFTAVYDKNLVEILPPANIILNENSFTEQLNDHKILFFGNGSVKFCQMTKHSKAVFKTIDTDAKSMILQSLDKYKKSDFLDLAYAEPFYGKEFYSPGVNNLA
jgi:tRNA threonylcarbamoyladenosine biosynthesis protein TsaB